MSVTFLETGTIKADRHSSGIVPVLTDIWNIFVRAGAMWLAYSWSDKQHSFRSKHSCETQLSVTIDSIARTLADGGQVDIILLDFSKAFDTVAQELCGWHIHGVVWLEYHLDLWPCDLILLSSFSTPASPMCISGISGYGL
jgi:hypothetical protein